MEGTTFQHWSTLARKQHALMIGSSNGSLNNLSFVIVMPHKPELPQRLPVAAGSVLFSSDHANATRKLSFSRQPLQPIP
jgi:hypothetical protein